MHRNRVVVVALAMAWVAGCTSGSDPAPQTPPAPPPSSGRPAVSQVPPLQSPARGIRYLADDLPLLPEGLATAQFPVDVIRASYEFAARHPEVLNYIPCFCGCERAGHKGSH